MFLLIFIVFCCYYFLLVGSCKILNLLSWLVMHKEGPPWTQVLYFYIFFYIWNGTVWLLHSIYERFITSFLVDRFKSDEERTPVYRIVDETFPLLLNIFSRLVQIGNPSLEVAELIKFICKIFWSSIYVSFFYLKMLPLLAGILLG